MISSDKSDSLGVSHLEGQQEQERLDRVVASIDEIAHEQVVGVGALASHLEELHQVVELSVNVTADSDWGFDVLHIRFFDKDLFGPLTQSLDFALLNVLALLKLLNPLV